MGRKKNNKKLECLECLHCKTRVFETIADLNSWCGRKSIKPNSTWLEEIVDLGRVRLMWCEKQAGQHSSHGFSPRNASPRHVTNIETILEEEKTGVFISNQSKKSFITGAWDVCPFRSI